MKIFRYLACSALLLLPAVQRADETVIENRTYESGEHVSVAGHDTIETNGAVTVKAGADVFYAAARQITLGPGFHVEQGAVFRAWVPNLDDAVLFVLDGDGQTAPAGSFNARPFDMAVWHGSTPLPGQSVTFTVEQGGGLLSPTPAGQGASQLTLATDADGTVLAYYRHGSTAGVLSSIRVEAVGKNLTLKSLSNSETTGGTGGTGNTGTTATSDVNGFAAWALAHGLDPNAPYADTDGDGICNLEEYLQDRDPHTRDASLLALEIFSPNQ